MIKKLLLPLLFLSSLGLYAQTPTNLSITNPEADLILKGRYNPNDYNKAGANETHDVIAKGINNNVSPDSLKALIIKLAEFKNRNTGADTVSDVTGIGAARRWVYSKFEDYARQEGNNRLITSYMQFDQDICGMRKHRNIFSILPGTDTTDKSVVIIEGHIDSRCVGLCDTACVAEGVEDNATGTALVMELARTMSKFSYKHTIVFLVVIGEEQGLFGANAFSDYVRNNGIQIKAVLNNDVIGGVICGATSSSPKCPGLNDIDSTQVRIFSSGSFNSTHKNFARYTKLQYKEEILSEVKVPMLISIMSAEDRTGRGGDHIPFRQKGYRAVRFTSANEHGDASNSANYTDRQHTEKDGLGVDTDNDAVIDSFFVDFNYLGRNAVINGVSAAMTAIGPKTPAYTITGRGSSFDIKITDPKYSKYRVAMRTNTNDWDTVYTMQGSEGTFPANGSINYIVSAAAMDEEDVESLFGTENLVNVTGIVEQSDKAQQYGITLMQNKPNPFDEATTISFLVNDTKKIGKLSVKITDLQGKLVKEYKINPQDGMNELLYEHGYGAAGSYLYSVVIDGTTVASKQMIFAN